MGITAAEWRDYARRARNMHKDESSMSRPDRRLMEHYLQRAEEYEREAERLGIGKE